MKVEGDRCKFCFCFEAKSLRTRNVSIPKPKMKPKLHSLRPSQGATEARDGVIFVEALPAAPSSLSLQDEAGPVHVDHAEATVPVLGFTSESTQPGEKSKLRYSVFRAGDCLSKLSSACKSYFSD